jgi:hypothetical protein
MKKLVTIIGILCGVTLALSACAAPGTASTATTASTQATAAATTATYTDPFSYCAAVGTIDTVDTRYSGEKVPDTVISGYLKAAGLENSTEPMDTLKAGTTWRCMDGKVYACNVGANLPCASQANTDKTPTQAMKDYCATNSEATDIPASVTGHETVYAWNCSKGAVVLGKQLVQPDAQGFLSDIWYAIEK